MATDICWLGARCLGCCWLCKINHMTPGRASHRQEKASPARIQPESTTKYDKRVLVMFLDMMFVG